MRIFEKQERKNFEKKIFFRKVLKTRVRSLRKFGVTLGGQTHEAQYDPILALQRPDGKLPKYAPKVARYGRR